ncbi:MAG: hypothetical protein M1837_005323 [Sclerophora amabilis]|nr:MAG: hypothetical protein M1837_005323 [Sclerophora amabilis]
MSATMTSIIDTARNSKSGKSEVLGDKISLPPEGSNGSVANGEISIPSNPLSKVKKRKRGDDQVDEIEVDISAPEPPSKKALRKAKKSKAIPPTNPDRSKSKSEAEDSESSSGTASADQGKPITRSDFGIWVGNLSYSITRADLRRFITKDSSIEEDQITRIHVPSPGEKGATPLATAKQRNKPQNKGFAYIDLKTPEALAEALTLSETLLGGRRVLIKDSKSFEGRPEKPSTNGDPASNPQANSTKPPSKRIFVGNLGFDISSDDLKAHFTPCGEVEDIHMATFEDSGKCKGYAWVRFRDIDAAMAAVRGWVKVPEKVAEEDSVESSEDETSGTSDEDGRAKRLAQRSGRKSVAKTRKWWVNRIKGRPLRMEFAEDKTVRYKKRFGKDSAAKRPEGGDSRVASKTDLDDTGLKTASASAEPIRVEAKPSREHASVRPPKGGRKVDARTFKPGAALTNTSRSTGAIVKAKKGKKTGF